MNFRCKHMQRTDRLTSFFRVGWSSDSKGGKRLKTALFLLLLLAIGFSLRLRNLGDLTLCGDEGVQALALKGLLECGVPLVPSGLIYLRDAFFIYLQYALLQFVELTPYWIRFPSVLLGTLVLLPAYGLAKMLFDRKSAQLTVLLLTFSQFEIELSRYGRSYTLFQLLFVLALIFFYQGFLQNKKRYKIGFLITALFTFASHYLGAILLVLFLVPLLFKRCSGGDKLKLLFWAAAVLLGCFCYQKALFHLQSLSAAEITRIFPFETAGLSVIARSAAVVEHALYKPQFVGLQDPSHVISLHWALPVLCAVGCAWWCFYRIYPEADRRTFVFVLVMLLSACLHQYAFALSAFLFYVLFYLRDQSVLCSRPFRMLYRTLFITFLCWIIFLGVKSGWHLQELGVSLFGFPHLGKYFFFWYLVGWPVMSVVVIYALLVLLNRFLPQRRDPAAIFIPAVLVLSIVLASFFKSYAEARYTFHLYPLLVMLFSYAVVHLGRSLRSRRPNLFQKRRAGWAILAGVALLYASQDADPLQAWRIADRGYTTPKHPIRTQENWPPYVSFHQDHETPARYVQAHRSRNDLLIAIGGVHQLMLYHWYAGKVDYVVSPSDRKRWYYSILSRGIEVNYVTGSRIIHAPAEFDELLRRAPASVWLLGDMPLLTTGADFYPEADCRYLRAIIKRFDFIGRDNRTFAVKLK